MSRKTPFLVQGGLTLGHFLCVILQQCAQPVSAGVCWMSRTNNTDLCRAAFYNYNLTRDECCRIKTMEDVSWTPHENPSQSDFFYWMLLGGAPECHRCHNTCRGIVCRENKRCRLLQGVPKCVCRPSCDPKMKVLGHVCGTDGRRYRNYCSLQRFNCQYEQQIDIAYFGSCKNSCRNVKCYNHRHCLEDQNGFPHCVSCYDKCPFDTPTNYFCGEDGVTYNNSCELKAAICRLGRSIRVAYQGKCIANITCADIRCHDKCLTDPRSGQPVCTDCRRVCGSSISVPVCGTDKRTYPSYCEMQTEACNSGVVIRTRHNGKCKAPKRHRRRKKFKERQKRRREKLRERKQKRNSQRLKGSLKKSKTSKNHVIADTMKQARTLSLPPRNPNRSS